MVALSVTPLEEATYTTNFMTEPERLEGVPGRYWHRLEDGRIQRDVCCVLGAWGPEREATMKIESTTFGTITIDGRTYEHDVIVRLSGEVVKRRKKLSKKRYGTSHVLSEDEAKFLFEKGCDEIVIGTGQMGSVHLSPEAEAYFERSEGLFHPH